MPLWNHRQTKQLCSLAQSFFTPMYRSMSTPLLLLFLLHYLSEYISSLLLSISLSLQGGVAGIECKGHLFKIIHCTCGLEHTAVIKEKAEHLRAPWNKVADLLLYFALGKDIARYCTRSRTSVSSFPRRKHTTYCMKRYTLSTHVSVFLNPIL